MQTCKPQLLLFGWYQPGTGFTRVLEALLPALTRHFAITWMGVGYRGPVFAHSPDVRVLPTNLHGGDLVGAYEARERWNELQPDAIFALNDIWYLQHYSRALAEQLENVPMVGYLPLDGQIPDHALVAELTGFSRLITYTESARADLRRALNRAEIATPVDCIGHGVDLRSFRPALDEDDFGSAAPRMHLAQDYFRLPEPSFVILNASRPDPRKRIDLTLEGFARFAAGRPDAVHLCLHQAHAHPQFVEPLRVQAARLGIEDRLLWYPESPGPLDDAQLNALYNACAVGINTAAGEGFGLVSFEHAATGAAQILPAQDALTELWGDNAWRLPINPVMTAHSPLRMCEVDADDVALALTDLYEDPDCYRRMAYAALARSRRPDLRWDLVADQLAAILLQSATAALATG